MRVTTITNGDLEVPDPGTQHCEPSARAVEDAFLVQTHDLLQTSNRAFIGTFAKELSLIEIGDLGFKALDEGIKKSHFSSRASAEDKVMQLLSQDIAYRLWVDSDFVTVEGLMIAGHQKCLGLGGERLNKSSLCNAVCEDLRQTGGADVKRITTHITRLLAAMEVFGLVKVTEVRTNLCCIEVQPRLDEIMRASLSAAGQIFDAQIGEGKSCND